MIIAKLILDPNYSGKIGYYTIIEIDTQVYLAEYTGKTFYFSKITDQWMTLPSGNEKYIDQILAGLKELKIS